MQKYLFLYTSDVGETHNMIECEGKTFTDALVNAYIKIPKNSDIVDYKHIKERETK